MPGTRWTTKEQETWLNAYYEEHYVPCIPSHNYTDFKPVFYEAWFKSWPETPLFCTKHGLSPTQPLTNEQQSELAKAIEARKTQLLSWMRWRANKARLQRQGSKKHPLTNLQVLVAKPKAKRKLTDEEAFSRLFYDEKIKPTFEAECERQGVDRTNKKARMEVCRRVTREGWMEAMQDEVIRSKVAEEQVRREVELAQAQQNDKGEGTSNDTTEQKASVVADLPAIFNELLGNLREQTDWSFTLLAGGPDYSKGAKKTHTFSVHVGETALGMNFVQSYPAFAERVMQPFDLFVRYVQDGSNIASSTTDTSSKDDASSSAITQSISGGASDKSESVYGAYTSDAYMSDAYMSDEPTASVPSRAITPASEISFAGEEPPHGAFLPMPPSVQRDSMGGYSFDDSMYDPFNDETLAGLSQFGATSASDHTTYGIPPSPPTSQYYTGRKQIQAIPAEERPIQDPILRSIVTSMSGIPQPPVTVTSTTSTQTPALHTTHTSSANRTLPAPGGLPVAPQAQTSDAPAVPNNNPLPAPNSLSVVLQEPTSDAPAVPNTAVVEQQPPSAYSDAINPSLPGEARGAAQTVESDKTPAVEVPPVDSQGRQPDFDAPLLGLHLGLRDSEEAHFVVAQQQDTSTLATNMVASAPATKSFKPQPVVAPRRSNRGSMPSTRNAMANEIGCQGNRRRKK